MHISLYIPVLTFGGAEKVIISLANGLAEKGHKVDLVLINTKGQLVSTVSPKVRIVDLGAKKTFMSVFKLSKYLKQNEPHILLSALDNANIVSSLAMMLAKVKTKHLIGLHTNLKQSYKVPRTRIHHLYPALMRRLFPRADHFIAVSHCVARESGNFIGVENGRIEVIYNPVINPEIAQKALEPTEHQWLDSEKYYTMVAVGRIFEAKDYPTLLKAFAIALPSIPNARLIILGDGKVAIKNKMDAIIQEEKIEHAVDVHGFVHNPYAFIKKASLFVLTSQWEGFGNVLVEALYLGKPVISTACKCGPEEILDNGKFGTLVPVGGTSELAKAMIEKATQEHSYDKVALDRHLQQMEDKYVIDRYEEFFKQRVEEMKG